MANNNVCAHCGGAVEKKLVTIDRRVEEKLLIFENVPAEVCSVCGAKWFSLEILKDMDRKLSEHLKPTRVANIPVYSIKEDVLA